MFHKIDNLLSQAISDGVFPSASLLIAQKGKIILERIVGSAQIFPEKRPLASSTFFDVASLTKPMATATLCMLAHQENKISLGDPLSKYFDTIHKDITLRHLLNHTSGLPAWKPYFETLSTEAPGWIGDEKGKNWLIERILVEPSETPISTHAVYSDLGYILLGRVLEQVYQRPLEDLFASKVAAPLGLAETFYNPIDRHKKVIDPNPKDFAATENCPWRKTVLSGEVHDDHAYLMGGVAGHAGLFSTAKDVYRWISGLQKAAEGQSGFISKETFHLFTEVPHARDISKIFFTLGFDTPSTPSSAGVHFSPSSLGHLGYTGTSFWWDRQQDVVVILLTNRVHPSRDNDKIKAFRPLLHDSVMETLASCPSA